MTPASPRRRARAPLAAAILAVLALLACEAGVPAPSASPSPAASPLPRIVVVSASCASPVPTRFEGRGAELGYVAYRTCRGRLKNEGDGAASVDVWVDALDAQGRPAGSCRRSAGTVQPGSEREWEATCPVTAAETGFSVRVTDPGGTPLPTRSP